MAKENEHIKFKFLEWSEGKLSETEKDVIENHLSECKTCKDYYELMQDLTSPVNSSDLTELKPDPFLPTKIKAIANNENVKVQRLPITAYLRWFFITLASSAAICIGILLGQGLYNSKQSYHSNQSIVSAYYQVYSQEGLSDHFESTLSTGQENKK